MSTNSRQKEYCVRDNKCVLKQAGKGDMPRPSNKQKYDDNYNSINWSNKKKKKREK